MTLPIFSGLSGSLRTGRLPVGRRADARVHPARVSWRRPTRPARAFDRDDPAHRRGRSSGDVLLRGPVPHGYRAATPGCFTLDDVCDAVCRKLVFRHPVRSSAATVQELGRGEAAGEGPDRPSTETLGRRGAFAACLRGAAEKLQKKAAKCGLCLGIGRRECLG